MYSKYLYYWYLLMAFVAETCCVWKYIERYWLKCSEKRILSIFVTSITMRILKQSVNRRVRTGPDDWKVKRIPCATDLTSLYGFNCSSILIIRRLPLPYAFFLIIMFIIELNDKTVALLRSIFTLPQMTAFSK